MNEERYYELNQETIDIIQDFIDNEIMMPIRINYAFQGDGKLVDDVIKVTKVSPQYEAMIDKQILVSVNEEVFSLISVNEEATELILRESLECIDTNVESGKIKIVKKSFNTSPSILKHYGADTVIEVKELIKHTMDQVTDSKNM